METVRSLGLSLSAASPAYSLSYWVSRKEHAWFPNTVDRLWQRTRKVDIRPTHTHTHTHIHTHTHTYTNTHTQTYIHTYIHTNTHTPTERHRQINRHTDTHTHTHTHTHDLYLLSRG